jgi:hypothetical protein
MGRKLRYAPEGGALFEITDRTIQGRPLFRPSPELNEVVLGVLGRAQRRGSSQNGWHFLPPWNFSAASPSCRTPPRA